MVKNAQYELTKQQQIHKVMSVTAAHSWFIIFVGGSGKDLMQSVQATVNDKVKSAVLTYQTHHGSPYKASNSTRWKSTTES